MIDVARALKMASDTGDVRFGLRSVRQAVGTGKARLVIAASNCPDPLTGLAVKVYAFPGTSVELGAACGKPFSVSALAVVEPGDSNILSV